MDEWKEILEKDMEEWDNLSPEQQALVCECRQSENEHE